MPESPLRQIVQGWVEKLTLAMDYKQKRFGEDAEEAMSFFNGPYEFMYGMKYRSGSRGFVYTGGDTDMPKPTFAMTVNKVAEMVQIFGPVLYHKNPVRQVNPRKVPVLAPEALVNPADPNSVLQYQQMAMLLSQQQATDDARSKLLESYLNYTPTALGLKEESRAAIDEAIIKGMGVLWTELYKPAGMQIQMVGSFYDTVDNLCMDPDMEEIEHCKWYARRCVHPVWQVEQEYGLQPGSLRGNTESLNQQGLVQADPDGDYRRKQGVTNDLIVYWKIWSKMGMGGLLSGMAATFKQELDRYGQYVYLVIAETTDYPLNVPPNLQEAQDDQAIYQAVQWPTPYWADDSMPFTPIQFHKVPRCVWPMSHLKPAMGELKFINWAYSFIAGKIKTTCRDFVAIKKAVGEDIKNTILRGQDLELLEIEAAHGTISEMVQFLQHPSFNGDIWRVIEAVEQNFEKRVGLTELSYGMSASQFRSAAEAQVKSNQLSVRPDDMNERVEEAMTQLSRREAFAARWHLQPQDVAPMFGPVGAYWWQQLLQGSDPNEVLHQLEYRIEAGSTKKPNKDRDAANMQQAMTTLFTPLFQYAQATGNVGPVNALIESWAKSIDLEADKFLLAAPPPPVPAPAPGGGKGSPQPGGPTPAPQQQIQQQMPLAMGGPPV